jgi:hypothetical protein
MQEIPFEENWCIRIELHQLIVRTWMWFCDKKTEKAIKDDCHLSPFLECEEVWEKSVLTILDTNEPLSDFFCFAKLSNI